MDGTQHRNHKAPYPQQEEGQMAARQMGEANRLDNPFSQFCNNKSFLRHP